MEVPALPQIVVQLGHYIAAHQAVAILTIIPLLAQKIFSNMSQPQSEHMHSFVQLTSAGLGIAATKMLGLSIGPKVLLMAAVASILIRAIAPCLCSNALSTAAPTNDTVIVNTELPVSESVPQEEEEARQEQSEDAPPPPIPQKSDTPYQTQIANLMAQLTLEQKQHTSLEHTISELNNKLNFANIQNLTLIMQIKQANPTHPLLKNPATQTDSPALSNQHAKSTQKAQATRPARQEQSEEGGQSKIDILYKAKITELTADLNRAQNQNALWKKTINKLQHELTCAGEQNRLLMSALMTANQLKHAQENSAMKTDSPAAPSNKKKQNPRTH